MVPSLNTYDHHPPNALVTHYAIGLRFEAWFNGVAVAAFEEHMDIGYLPLVVE
jgi:hypothetical protein